MSENPKKIQCLRKEDVRQAKKEKGRKEREQEELKRRGLRGSKKKKENIKVMIPDFTPNAEILNF